MSRPGLVIVGSGPAALSAARAFRDHDRQTPVTMLSADRYPPYARPPLTKDYLRGESGPDDLPLVEPGWYADTGVELRLRTLVAGVDPGLRQIRLSDTSTVTYRDLVLATGSRPVQLDVPGGDLPELIYVRDRVSGERLRNLAERADTRVAVVGSGFIGCEAAASLAKRGLDVIMITDEDVPHTSRLGPEAGSEIAGWLRADGVTVRTGSGVKSLELRGGQWVITLADGDRVPAGAVVCGGGAQPELDLARDAGCAIDHGGVVTDAQLRTSVPGIFAAGDIAYAQNRAAGRPLRVEHWGEAENQGTVAGAVAAGQDSAWDTAPGFWSEIGGRTLKYVAWGDGYQTCALSGSPSRWFVEYRVKDRLVGVLTYQDDDRYERGRQELESRAGEGRR